MPFLSLFLFKNHCFSFFISWRTNRKIAHQDLFAETREVSNARSIPPYSEFRVTRPASCVAETHTSRASTFPIFTTSRRARVWASLYRERDKQPVGMGLDNAFNTSNANSGTWHWIFSVLLKTRMQIYGAT